MITFSDCQVGQISSLIACSCVIQWPFAIDSFSTNRLPCWSLPRTTMSLHYMTSKASPLCVWLCEFVPVNVSLLIWLNILLVVTIYLLTSLQLQTSTHNWWVHKCHAFISAFIYTMSTPCICVSKISRLCTSANPIILKYVRFFKISSFKQILKKHGKDLDNMFQHLKPQPQWKQNSGKPGNLSETCETGVPTAFPCQAGRVKKTQRPLGKKNKSSFMVAGFYCCWGFFFRGCFSVCFFFGGEGGWSKFLVYPY